MFIGELNKKELEFLETSLNNNKGMSSIEIASLERRHPYAIMRDDNALIISDMTHYGFHDKELNNFLLSKFGTEEFQLDFFYKLDYKEGNETTPHKDKYFVLQTTLILLSDGFSGGNLIVDGKNVNLNKRGMYINFEGNKKTHYVTKVESGVRSVLVVMFNKKSNNLL
jgi:hypothetical protein